MLLEHGDNLCFGVPAFFHNDNLKLDIFSLLLNCPDFGGTYNLIMVGFTISGNDPVAPQYFPLGNYLGSAGSPYYEPNLNTTANGPAAFISNLYNIHTPFREAAITRLDIETVKNFHNVGPNPFTNHIEIHSGKLIDRIKLVDITGKLLYDENINSDNYYLNLENISLESGVYILLIYSDTIPKRFKLIKQ